MTTKDKINNCVTMVNEIIGDYKARDMSYMSEVQKEIYKCLSIKNVTKKALKNAFKKDFRAQSEDWTKHEMDTVLKYIQSYKVKIKK